jgi:hypothetical protein
VSSINAVTNIGLDKATVGLSSTPGSAAVDKWRVVAVTAGAVSSDVYHVARTGSSCVVYFSPQLSPGATYTISTTTTTGGVDTSSSQNFAAPATSKPLGSEWSHGLLRAWSRAVSQLIQRFTGVPATVTTQDIDPAEGSIYVESTLGFPLVGYLYVGSSRYRYTGRGPAAFHGVTADQPTTQVERRRQVVYLDTSSVWPPEATEYLTVVGRKFSDPNGVL